MKFWTESHALTQLGFTTGSSNNNFGIHAGIIYPKNGYKPTQEDLDAVWYLCSEWDYDYDEDRDDGPR